MRIVATDLAVPHGLAFCPKDRPSLSARGGTITNRDEIDHGCAIAPALGGRDGRTLYICKERGVDAKWASSIPGYWRRGRTEETFRQWKRELASREAEPEEGANA